MINTKCLQRFLLDRNQWMNTVPTKPNPMIKFLYFQNTIFPFYLFVFLTWYANEWNYMIDPFPYGLQNNSSVFTTCAHSIPLPDRSTPKYSFSDLQWKKRHKSSREKPNQKIRKHKAWKQKLWKKSCADICRRKR